MGEDWRLVNAVALTVVRGPNRVGCWSPGWSPGWGAGARVEPLKVYPGAVFIRGSAALSAPPAWRFRTEKAYLSHARSSRIPGRYP